MSIHIGDFWQSKQNKNVIYHVDNYAFEMNKYNNLTNSMMIILSKLCIAPNQDGGLFIPKPEQFARYARPDDLRQECKLILSAKRIAKDKKFQNDKDIFDYLAKKVGEQNGK